MDLDIIKEVTDSSNVIVTWSLSIIGASLVAIIGTDYIKPVGKWSKLIYILFIPGWINLILAIRLGNIISRRAIMAVINAERIPSILDKMNNEYASQLEYFNTGLIYFSIWLLLFLFWWIFHDFTFKLKKI